MTNFSCPHGYELGCPSGCHISAGATFGPNSFQQRDASDIRRQEQIESSKPSELAQIINSVQVLNIKLDNLLKAIEAVDAKFNWKQKALKEFLGGFFGGK